MAKKLDYEYCKAAPMLEWLGNKWALVVLVKISENESVRFNELYRNIPSVSEKVLSQVLRQLTTDGIIRRELFPDVPPRTEYSVRFRQDAFTTRRSHHQLGTRKLRSDNVKPPKT